MSAADTWASALAQWAIPGPILAQAEQSPWELRPESFADTAYLALRSAPTVTHLRALEELPEGGSVLDVGAGAGAASLPLAARAGEIVAIDRSAAMLQELLVVAGGRTRVATVEGTWPQAAALVAAADVVVCANVAYNVPDLGPFVAALAAKARRRVVLELTAVHPQASLNGLWQHFWQLERPGTPTAEVAAAVVAERLRVEVAQERWVRPALRGGRSDPITVAEVRRRLCLTPESDREIAELLRSRAAVAPVEMVTMWWPGAA
ncbi:MAG TPA: methyltransferase domain-containing protein [Candidatus Nanopelagicaceae bacterium]|nr:methyltransferase domain-containing protein [Candidatus Nanopelagicaceae bacterium]